MKVSEILKVKGDILYTVTPESPLQQARWIAQQPFRRSAGK